MESKARQRTLELAARLALIRSERFGAVDIDEFAEAIGIAPEVWARYEAGREIPAVFLLRFIELTGASPRWLLKRKGPKYLMPVGPHRRGDESREHEFQGAAIEVPSTWTMSGRGGVAPRPAGLPSIGHPAESERPRR